jgi:hypothetical protein
MSEFSLYNGEVKISFEPKKHKYTILDNGVELKGLPSVTKVTGTVDKSGPLVNWAVKSTLEACRKRIIPGASYTAEELEDAWEEARKRWRFIKTVAANIGTAAHSWLEKYFTGQNPPLPGKTELHRPCIDASLDWLAKHKVRFLDNERAVYSRKYKVSGIMDGRAEVDDALTLIDWKTGNGIYGEMRLQTAAYAEFYEEETNLGFEKRAIIRLGKEDGRFHSMILDQKEAQKPDFKAFAGTLDLYNGLQVINKEIKAAQLETGEDWLDTLEET